MIYVPYIALMVAALCAWKPRWLSGAIVLLCVGYASASVMGQLAWPAALAVGGLLVAALAAMRPERGWQIVGHLLFLALATAFLLHAVPGFANRLVWGPVQVSPGAVSYSMYLNLDKPLIGFWVLLACGWLRHAGSMKEAFFQGTRAALLTSGVVLVLAWALGLVGWAPKWPPEVWIWLLNNLLLVCFAEEALFRGYIQGGLARLWQGRRGGSTAAWLVATLVFGLAHLPGGWAWVAAATVAGLGYGWAYRHGGLQAAMLAHFGLNVLHFVGFTYPMISSSP